MLDTDKEIEVFRAGELDLMLLKLCEEIVEIDLEPVHTQRQVGPLIVSGEEFLRLVIAEAGNPAFHNPRGMGFDDSEMLYLIFFVGPFVGAILAVLIYQFLSAETVSVEDDDREEVEVEEVVVEEKPAKKPAARKSTKK